MIDIDIYMRAWIRWNKRQDAREIARVGFKSSGIEYRIMQEAGALPEDDTVRYHSPDERMAEVTDFVIRCLIQTGWPLTMETMEKYYLCRKSNKATAERMGQSRDKTKRLIREGTLLLQSGILVLEMHREVQTSR